MENQRIFTTGYTGKDINDLKPMLEALDAMLIDVRFVPYSQVFHWRKIYLKSLLGEKYRHIPNLGNRTYKENKITIQNLELGIKTILNLPTNLILMCACPKLPTCHRRVIFDELFNRGVNPQEISDWKNHAGFTQKSLF